MTDASEDSWNLGKSHMGFERCKLGSCFRFLLEQDVWSRESRQWGLLNEEEINYGDLHFCCWLFSKDIILGCLDVGYVLWENRRCIFGIESWENGDL